MLEEGYGPPLLITARTRYPLRGACTRYEPSEPFPDLHTLTQEHSRNHSCTDNTHSGWARPRRKRLHTERSSPFQALPLRVQSLKYLGPGKYPLSATSSCLITGVPRPDE